MGLTREMHRLVIQDKGFKYIDGNKKGIRQDQFISFQCSPLHAAVHRIILGKVKQYSNS